MTTTLDIINLALLDAGVIGQGQTASAEDTNNAYTRMQWMIQQWQRKRYLVFHLLNINVTSTGQTTPYTIGPGGQFQIGTRPDKLENGCFFRQLVQSSPNQVDYPLELLESFEDYNTITLKKLTTFPGYIFLDPSYPLGSLYVWPVPQAGIYSINVLVKATLIDIITANALTTVLDATLPNEYFKAIYESLAEILRSAYRLPPDPALTGRAKESREVLRDASAAIARLRMPADLIRPGTYNVYSDQIT
jgi:hypothetical protein